MLLNLALDWFKNNKDELLEASIGEIDYYPPNGDDSFSFGFEGRSFVYQVVIWEEGYIKLLRLNKQTMIENVENIRVNDSTEMWSALSAFLRTVQDE